jgi:transcriptional regulator with XRE-family HTH domain
MVRHKSSKLARQVSRRIRELRLSKYITQEQFLFDTGIHIGRIESHPKHLQIDTLNKICNYMAISLKEFFQEGFD